MSYIGAAANVAGGIIQSAAALKARQAMAEAFNQEMARQQAYKNQARGILDPAIATSGVENARQQLALGAQNRLVDYSRLANVNLGLGQPNAPTMTLDRLYEQQRGNERARLGAYSDYSLASALKQLHTQQGLDKVINFAKGTASVYPYRAYDAQHSADDIAMIGQMISSIGGSAANWAQYAQGPQGAGPGGVTNWGSLNPSQQQDYWQQYWYYNSPSSPYQRTVAYE